MLWLRPLLFLLCLVFVIVCFVPCLFASDLPERRPGRCAPFSAAAKETRPVRTKWPAEGRAEGRTEGLSHLATHLVVVARGRLLVSGPQGLQLRVQDVQELLDQPDGHADVAGVDPPPRQVHQLARDVGRVLAALDLQAGQTHICILFSFAVCLTHKGVKFQRISMSDGANCRLTRS